MSALTEADLSRVIEMAWDDQVSFEAIELAYGLSESAVIALMRRSLKPGSYRVWRERVSGRAAKHDRRQRSGEAGSPGQPADQAGSSTRKARTFR